MNIRSTVLEFPHTDVKTNGHEEANMKILATFFFCERS
jgi:hypothetical protein